MGVLMRWTLFFAVLMMAVQSSHSYTFSSKGRVNGPAIHSSYFFTPNNQDFPVQARAYVGNWVNGTCVYAGQYEMGVDTLRTGNFVDIDAFKLKSIVGGGYSCMTISYYFKQPVLETFQLVWDGFNYNNTLPATADVTIL